MGAEHLPPGTTCDVCGRGEDIAGVAAVPGAAISIVWCHECLDHRCQPLFALEVHMMHGPMEDGSPHPADESLKTMIAYAKTTYPEWNPTEVLAEWFLEEETWYEDAYIKVADLFTKLYEEA